MNTLIKKAHDLAKEKHEGQYYDNKDYFDFHIKQVVEMLANTFCNKEVIIVGYLHDILEDTTVTPEEIEDLFGTKVLEAIQALTRGSSETYSDYIERASKNNLSLQVKYQDVLFNLKYTLSRLEEEESKVNIYRFKKYSKALKYLGEC